MNPDQEKKLEQLIHRTLRETPPRKAPRTLEARVMAEIGRRAALPWWRQSFVHWPMAMRLVFVLSSGAIAALLVMIATRVNVSAAEFEQTFASQLAWIDAIRTAARAMTGSAGAMTQDIPTLWLYSGAAIVVALYVALFGLGTAAYRTLYAQR
jgi:hypothetical protein